MAADGRFGGHIVAGHIDGTGKIRAMQPEGNAVLVTVSAAPELLRYVVEKGSIAIDGISLTVAKVTHTDFTVSLIPHTGERPPCCATVPERWSIWKPTSSESM